MIKLLSLKAIHKKTLQIPLPKKRLAFPLKHLLSYGELLWESVWPPHECTAVALFQ